MAKQLQVRRGVEQAQNLFTGAEGEITMTTDTKELRIHDGTKAGGFRVPTLVAVQYPSAANNYTWYRKYSDGWVEQGGMDEANTYGTTAKAITLPITMADGSYTVLLTKFASTTGDLDGAGVAPQVAEITTTGFKWSVTYTSSLGRKIRWFVAGMAA